MSINKPDELIELLLKILVLRQDNRWTARYYARADREVYHFFVGEESGGYWLVTLLGLKGTALSHCSLYIFP